MDSPGGVKDSFTGGGMGGLSGFGGDEVYEPRRNVKRSMSNDMKRAMKSLEYSEIDLELLADDNKNFQILKESLRSKGAVTNEVLKQKLPLYVKYRKDRMARHNPKAAEAQEAMRRLPARSRSTGKMKPVSEIERQSVMRPANRVLTDDEMADAGAPQSITQQVSRILRPAAKRNLPARSKTNNW